MIPDIIKWAMDGKLQDMEEVLGEKMETLPLHPAAKKAGVFDGKRYFVPLGMTLTGVLTTETWLGKNDLTADNTKDFFSEVFADRKLPPKDTLNAGLSNIFCEPFIDYNEHKFVLQEEQEEVLTFLLRKQDSVMEAKNPVKLTFLGDANAYYGESFASTWVMQGENPVFLTIPDQNGRNAAVARYAAVRNGSDYQEEAAKLIEWLLEEKWQIESAVLKGTTIIQKSIPVNLSAVEESFFRRIEICMGVTAEGEMKERLEKTAKQMTEEVEKITTLRFCAQENRLIKECVIDEIERGGSVEKALENLQVDEYF